MKRETSSFFRLSLDSFVPLGPRLGGPVFRGPISEGTIGPLVRDWHGQRSEVKKYSESVADFERRIPDLAERYPVYVGLASKGESQDIKGLEDIRVDRAAAKLPP